MKEISLFIDESGNLGTGCGRYFLICALEMEKEMQKSLSHRAKRVMGKYKERNAIRKGKEIKGTDLKKEKRIKLIKNIIFSAIKVRYIILDKKHTTMFLKKADDKNACYNYLVQLIVKQVLIDYPKLTKVNLYLDNRSVKIGNRLSLKPYLYNQFVLDKVDNTKKPKEIEFNVTYFESERSYLIQWADIISNSIYKRFDSNEVTYYNIIKPYIIFESYFPKKKFGK